MARIELRNVTKLYGNNMAVDNISLICEDGEFLVLLGPAGAGKTSTLKMISGVESVSSGSISIGGRVVNCLPPEQRNVGMVFENYALYPHMSVFDNIAFPLRAPARSPKLNKGEILERVTQVAGMLEIEGLLQRRPDQLSGGQRQRVGLGRALVRNPDAMLLDEPIAHLDAKLRNSMRAELKRLQKETGVTTLYATPDYAQALGMADRIAVLCVGRLQQIGPPMEVYNVPANVAVASMLSDPKINLLEGELRQSGDRLEILTPAVQLTLPPHYRRVKGWPQDGHCVLGSRPADIRASRTRNEECPIGARLRLVEPVGSRMIMTVEIGEQSIKLKVPFEHEWKQDDPVWLGISPDSLLVFSKDTGHNLDPAAQTDASREAVIQSV